MSLADFASTARLKPRLGQVCLTPAALASKSEEAERLKVAIGRLPEAQRVAVMLRYAAGMTYDEMAAYLDVPYTGAGEYLVRIDRKGDALTSAVDAQNDGAFKPDLFKRVDDITTYVAFLNAHAAILRLRHGGIRKQIHIRHAGGTLPELPGSRTAPAGRDRGRVGLRSSGRRKGHLPRRRGGGIRRFGAAGVDCTREIGIITVVPWGVERTEGQTELRGEPYVKGSSMPRSSLAKVSTAILKEELRRRLAALPRLIAQRDELNRQLAELEALGATEEAAKPAKARAPRKRARKVQRAKNPVTLAEALAKAIKAKESMSIAEATEAVLASGYKSTSKNFKHVVKQTLSHDKRFERVGTGQYAVKE